LLDGLACEALYICVAGAKGRHHGEQRAAFNTNASREEVAAAAPGVDRRDEVC